MRAHTQTRPLAAAGSMIAAMAIIGLVDIWVIVVAQTISVWQFLIARMVLAVPLILLLAWLGFGSVWPQRFGAVLLRSFLVAMGMFFYFGALAFMPIALALAGLFTSPIFVLLITAFILRQRIGPWRISAVALGFTGILVVLGLSGGSLGWVIVLPVLGGILYACGAVATRALCEGESTLALLICFFLMQGALGALIMAGVILWSPEVGEGGRAFLTRGWVWPLDAVLPYLILQAFGSVIGVGLLNRAYQIGEASHVAVFEYTIMIFAPFFAWWLQGQPVSGGQAVGIALIAVAGTIIALRSRDV